jgi:hypothetical protein
MALLGRIFAVGFGFLIAVLAATIVLALGFLLPQFSDAVAFGVEHGIFPVAVGFGAFLLSVFAFLPAMIVIALAEAFRLRSVFFYAALGGLGMLALYYGAGFADHFAGSPMPRELELVAASGIVAGLVYWLLVGRNAGRWCERPESAAT